MATSFTLSLDTPPGVLLAHFAPHLHIVHQVPGRVRFKLDAAALAGVKLASAQGSAPSSSDAVAAVLKRIPGVRDIGLNWLARSCTITYDPRLIADAAWADLLAGRDTPAAQTLHTVLDQAYAHLRAATS